ncbi:MAG: zf-TFIIB domain-containing protein [Chlamydiota bacterium]|nr:zf-TFIIB domain-containing protein [Chlamydiota bacterium]
MLCPACGHHLSSVTVSGITIDVCKEKCSGLWFDGFELKKFDEPHEPAGDVLLETDFDPSIKIDHSKKRGCPKCPEVVMMRHFYSVKREVEVDECPSCGGFWLDRGELSMIRTQYASEDQRKKALDAYFQEMFGEHLLKMKTENQGKLEKSRKIAQMLRFVCPSNYIPGKQNWGAF